MPQSRSPRRFTIGDAVSVKLAGETARLTVPEAKTLTGVTSTVANYKPVRTVADGIATYQLEKKSGLLLLFR